MMRFQPGWTSLILLTAIIMFAHNPAQAEESAPAWADSSQGTFEVMTVSGEAAPPPATSETRVPAPAVTLRDPGSLADLGAVLPSVRVSTNSRGDSHLMIRGAPERHVQTFIDGIPLNLPWDERVDLETIPVTGLGRLEGRRGMPSLLDGPGVLAGSVRILAPDLDGRSQRSVLSLASGSHGLGRANLTHQRQSGQWNLLAAGGWHGRDSFPLPDSGDARFNSDLNQISLLLRGSRGIAQGGRLNLLATAWGGEKGVPPEMHLGEDARFWRYPLRNRVLLGSSIFLPLGSSRHWEMNAMAAVDFFRQEIDARGPDHWDDRLESGQEFEIDKDQTGHLTAGLTRHFDEVLGGHGRLSLQTNWRYTRHRETLVFEGPENTYSQVLGAVVLEGELTTADSWHLRGGIGLDQASTPESGDKPGAENFTDPAWNLRLTRDLGAQAEVYATASERSRFPSLRELYSGALGKFVPNPDLVAERQNLLEAGASVHGSGWNLSGAAFRQDLHDGIEKEKLPDSSGQFMRVNRTRIRVSGLELAGNYRLNYVFDMFAQHTILNARTESATGFDQPAEDRPDYLSRAGLSWQELTGPGAMLEAEITGARWSADATNDETGLTYLPAAVTWNLRLGWTWQMGTEGDGRPWELTAHLRLDNLFDQVSYYQVGLPEAGRIISGGLTGNF